MYNEEQKIQEGIAYYLMVQHPEILFTISPVGLNRGTKMTRIRNGADAKRMGYNKGTPDMMIFHSSGRFSGLFIEVKTWTGRPTPEQNEFFRDAVLQKFCCEFAYGYDHAKAMIEWYMNQDSGSCPVKKDFSESVYAVISRARRKRKASK